MLQRYWHLFGTPLLAGALLRVLWLTNLPRIMVWDEVDYHSLGKQLASGGGYGVQLFPPGWPMLLGLIYRATGAYALHGMWFNLLVSLLTIVLVGHIALRYTDPLTARCTAWLVALMPSYILTTGMLVYEVWLQCLLVLALVLALHERWTWLDGLLLACITALVALMRPFWLALPVLLWLVVRPPSRQSIAVLLLAQLGALLLVAPWVAHISMLRGEFVPIGLNGNINFWIGNNRNATGTFMEPPYGYWLTYSDIARDRALAYLQEHPFHMVRLVPLKLWHMLATEAFSGLYGFLLFETHMPIPLVVRWLVDALLNGSYWLICGLACVGIGVLVRRRQWIVLAPLLLFTYNLACHILFFGLPRFRWPVQFVLLLYAAAGLTWLIQSYSAHRSRQPGGTSHRLAAGSDGPRHTRHHQHHQRNNYTDRHALGAASQVGLRKNSSASTASIRGKRTPNTAGTS
ncbi:MAG: hypothetical protein HC876_12265 [Chloroflexaceae bacterium]|nr:hypothetical protein [Chloroflexaceae bacterium]